MLEQVKLSVRKFQSRDNLTSENRVKLDEALVSNIKEALVSEGWMPPTRTKSYGDSARNLPQNSSNYKGKKNLLGNDGEPLTCFNCQSEYHFSDKCELKKKASGKENKKKKENLSNADTMLSVLLKQRAKGVRYYRESNEEEVMMTHDEEELCFLLEEAGIRGVLDTACSKSVAGLKWISKYTEDLPQDITESLKLQPS